MQCPACGKRHDHQTPACEECGAALWGENMVDEDEVDTPVYVEVPDARTQAIPHDVLGNS